MWLLLELWLLMEFLQYLCNWLTVCIQDLYFIKNCSNNVHEMCRELVIMNSSAFMLIKLCILLLVRDQWINIVSYMFMFVCVQIIQTDDGKVCGQNDTNFQSDGSTSTFRVMFKEPVEIQPNNSYTACATLKVHYDYIVSKTLWQQLHSLRYSQGTLW